MFKKVLLVVLVLVLVAGLAEPGKGAQSTAIYKKGDVVKIIVPWAAGGGYDRIARLIQPYLQKALRESTNTDVTLIVDNITGGGGLLGHTTFAKAKPNGLTLGVLGFGSIPFQQLATKSFDANKFGYLGQINVEPYLIPLVKDSPMNTFPDMIARSQQKSIMISTGGQGAAGHIDPLLAQAILKEHNINWKIDFVHYDGGAPGLLAIVKKEVDTNFSTEANSLSMITSGDFKPVVLFSSKRGDFLPGVPTLREQRVSGAEELEALSACRMLAVPPGMEKGTLDVLRAAFQKVMNDPVFQETVKKANLPLQYKTAEETTAVVAAKMRIAEKYKDIILPIYK